MGVRVRGATLALALALVAHCLPTLALALALALVAHCLPSLTAWPKSSMDRSSLNMLSLRQKRHTAAFSMPASGGGLAEGGWPAEAEAGSTRASMPKLRRLG